MAARKLRLAWPRYPLAALTIFLRWNRLEAKVRVWTVVISAGGGDEDVALAMAAAVVGARPRLWNDDVRPDTCADIAGPLPANVDPDNGETSCPTD